MPQIVMKIYYKVVEWKCLRWQMSFETIIYWLPLPPYLYKLHQTVWPPKRDCQARKSLKNAYVKRKTSENNSSSLKLTEVQYTTINNDYRSQLVLRLVSKSRTAYRFDFRKKGSLCSGRAYIIRLYLLSYPGQGIFS